MLSLFFILLAIGLLAQSESAAAVPSPIERLRSVRSQGQPSSARPQSPPRATTFFANPKAADFAVDSSRLPLVTFPLQPSWAGRLPVSGKAGETRQLFFWYWPTSKNGPSDTLTVWLNGGPGCSSLGGFLQENGPISFQPGASAPKANPYSWTTASDMLWIEQPVGTGFSLGTPDIHNEQELSDEFYGFLQQFYTVFPELVQKRLFFTGESYAGFYIPYIATRIVSASAAEKKALPLSLQGLLINDGTYSSFTLSEEIPVANFVSDHQSTLGFSNDQVATFQKTSVACGYQKVIDQLVYPPKGKIDLPNGNQDIVTDGCELFFPFLNQSKDANPCFNIDRVTDKCPTPVDPMGGYFSRADVQEALHVPGFGKWTYCTTNPVFIDNNDLSPYTETLFPHLLDTLPRGITLMHGLDDGVLLSLADRITIQNLTWSGAQGFQAPPSTPLMVGGIQKGVFHSERKLTYIEISNAGHMVPTDQPQAALHIFQSVLGQKRL